MADDVLDRLSVEIESSATTAVKEVSALVSALRRLQKTIDGMHGNNAVKTINGIGVAANGKSANLLQKQNSALKRATTQSKNVATRTIKNGALGDSVRHVSVVVKAQTKDAEKNVSNLKEETDRAAESFKRAAEAAKELNGSRDVEEGYVPKVDTKDSSGFFYEIKQSLSGVKKSFLDATGGVEGFKTILSNRKGTISGFGKGLSTALDGFIGKFPKLAAAVQIICVLSDAFKKFFDQVKKGANQMLSTVKKVFSKFSSLAKKSAGNIARFFKSQFEKIGSYVGDHLLGPIRKLTDSVNKWKSSIGRVAFYRLIRSAIKMVTDGFKEGIENLYYFSSMVGTQFAPAMDRLATSSLYLKNSLGAMAGPLIQAIAPAIDFLVDKFVQLLNVVNMVFAALGGKSTYTKAVKNAAKYGEDLEDSMGGAASAANEFKRYLIGIDELNVIPDQSSPGGGGGGGNGAGLDYGNMFEQAQLPDWAKGIKDAIQRGDWYGVGEELAKSLGLAIDYLDKWVTSDELINKMTKIVDNITSAINGFFSTAIDESDGESIAYSLGDLIADSANLALSKIDQFFDNVKWENIGIAIGQSINGVFENMDASLLGDAIASYFNAGIEIFAGKVRTIKWEVIGSKIADAINGIIRTLDLNNGARSLAAAVSGMVSAGVKALNNIDFSDLGRNIGKAIKKFLQTYDLGEFGIGDFLTTAFNKAVETVDSLLSTGVISSLAETLSRGIETVVRKTSLQNAADVLGKMLDALVDGAITVTSNEYAWSAFGTKIANSLKTFFLDHRWLEGAGTALGTTLHGVVTSVKNFTNQFKPQDWKSLGNKIADSINSFFNNMTPEDWGDLGKALHSLGEGVLNAAQQAIDNIDWDTVQKSIGNFIDGLDITDLQDRLHKVFRNLYDEAAHTLLDVLAELSRVTANKFFEGLKDKISRGFSNLKWIGDSIAGFLENISTKLYDFIFAADDWVYEKILSPIGTALSSGFGYLKEIGKYIVDGLFGGISDALSDVGGWIKEHIVDPMVNGVKSLFGIASPSTVFAEIGGYLVEGLYNGISSAWETITGFFSDTLGKLGGLVSDGWEAIKVSTETAWDTVSGWLGDTWESIKGTASKTWENISSGVGSAWDKITGDTSTKTGSVKSDVSSAFNSVKSSISTTLQSAKSTASSSWDNIKTTVSRANSSVSSAVSSAWSRISSSLSGSLGGVQSSVSSTFSSIVSSAWSWGSDLAANIANGISYGVQWVKNAASNVAGWIRSYLHFSVPDIGPLKDFDTYMPDMMKQMAAGISGNRGLVLTAVSDLTSDMAKRFGFTAEPEVVGRDLSGELSYSVKRADIASQRSESMRRDDIAEVMQTNNEDLISVIFGAAQQIITAINEKDTAAYMDGRKVSNETTASQNRLNIMFGKSLQNA